MYRVKSNIPWNQGLELSKHIRATDVSSVIPFGRSDVSAHRGILMAGLPGTANIPPPVSRSGKSFGSWVSGVGLNNA
jgi:hypothetical protein